MMSYDTIITLLLIFTLLMLSGLVSASEVSFFSLPAGAKEKFSKSRIKAHKLVA